MDDIINEKRQNFKITPDIFVIIALGLWTIFNMFQGAFTDLSADEAYYYVISQSPSWGYFDHPPMNMWLIYFSSLIFGGSELGIRLFTILLQPVYLYLFWLTIKTPGSKMRSAATYILLVISMPLLQVYGWIATPDAPLMMFSVLLLWSYRKFKDENRLLYALLMGVSMALLGYSKYHGALLVALLILSDLRLLISWKFWLGALLAVVLFLPHLYWQYSHDWVSFVYHLSGRTNDFEWENLWLYLLDLVTVFNPFIIVILVFYIVNRALVSSDYMGKTMKWIMWGFVLFFLWSVRNVHVQAQWIILVTLPVVYFMFTASEVVSYLRKYLIKVGIWMVVIFFAARVFLMIPQSENLLKFDMVGSDKVYATFAKSKIDSLPFIGNSNYQFSSKLAYYGKIMTYGRPSMDCRSSQYEFIDMEDKFKGKTVAVQVSDVALDNLGYGIPMSDTVITSKIVKEKVLLPKPHTEKKRVLDTSIFRRQYHYDTIFGDVIVWDTIKNYMPTEKISINVKGMPEKIHSDDGILATFEITNPYDYDIPISGPYSYKLYMHVRYGRFSAVMFQVGWPKKMAVIPANTEKLSFRKMIVLPKNIPSGVGTYGFSIVRLPFGGWYNSKRGNITITNIGYAKKLVQDPDSLKKIKPNRLL